MFRIASPKAAVQIPRDRWLYLILLLAALLRTYHLAYPPWDYHNWRQTHTLMVARDFERRGFDLLYPQVAWVSDDRLSQPIYFSGEFSIESILTAVLYRTSGESHAAGRLVVIAFSLAGIYFVYSLLDRRAGRAAARYGALLLALNPYWLFFGRAFMPEVPALGLALGGLNALDRWREENRPRSLFVAAVLTGLALLQSLTAAVVALPALFLFWGAYGGRSVRRWEPYLYAVVAGLPAFAWYTHSAALARTSGSSILLTENFGEHLARWLSMPFLKEVLMRLARETFSPSALVIVALGFVGLARGRTSWLFRLWLVAALAFLALIPDTLAKNYYYFLFLVPAGSALAGLALARMQEVRQLRRVVPVLLVLLAADALRCARPLYRMDRSPYDLGILLSRLTAPTDLVIAESGGSPNVLYAADRRGWIDAQNDLTRLERLANLGARYYASASAADPGARRRLLAALELRFYRLTTPDSPWPIYALDEPREILKEIPEGEIQNPFPVNFNNQIQMLGTSVRELLTWPTAFEITYYWQCLKKFDRNLRVFVHVTTPEGRIVFNQDHWLMAGHLETMRWNVGEVVRERYVVVLPSGLAAGSYQIRVGWFDPEKGDRLPIASPGASDGEHRARVAEIEVHRAPRYGWLTAE